MHDARHLSARLPHRFRGLRPAGLRADRLEAETMNMHASSLDIEKFRKIHAHVERGANEGERNNARRLAEAMAKKAGMTFDAAVSHMRQEGATTAGARHRGDWMDAFRREAEQARQEQYQRKSAQRAEVLTRYKTIFDVFEPTAWERALRKAVSSFSTFVPYQTPGGRRAHYTAKLDRCRGEVEVGKLTARARRAVETAYPMPDTIAGALEELKVWDRLRRDREAFVKDELQHHMEVEARGLILEEMLRSTPAKTWDDLNARFDWNAYEWSRQWINPENHEKDEDEFLSRLRADIASLRAVATPPMKSGQSTPDATDNLSSASDTPASRAPGAQSGHRTSAQKRAEVLSMLDSNPELSSREIARRVGVSPQTVSTWRKRSAT